MFGVGTKRRLSKRRITKRRLLQNVKITIHQIHFLKYSKHNF